MAQSGASIDGGTGQDELPLEPRASLLRVLRVWPTAMAGAVVVAVFLLAAILADVLAPYSAEEGNLDNRMAGPSPEHLLGTDKVGRDIFSRLMYGARQSVLLAVGAVLISQGLAAVVGLASGYFGGWFDLVA